MKQTVKHLYFTIFKVEEGVLKMAEDFVSERDAHEYAEENDYTEYIVLPLHFRDTVEITTVSAVQRAIPIEQRVGPAKGVPNEKQGPVKRKGETKNVNDNE